MTRAGQEHAFRFAGDDGTSVAGYRWLPPGAPRGVLQLAHGMGEHALRYRLVAERLTGAGLAVYANDHRGHGATAPHGLGVIGPGGFPVLAADMACLTRLARAEQPGLPVVLLGHSMGSFAAQLFLLDHAGLIDGAVLSGSAALHQRTQAVQQAGAARLQDYNRAFEPARTPFDWLSRDPDAVDAYIADPLCGFSLKPACRASMIAAAARMLDPEALRGVRRDLPLYLLTGDADPVNGALTWFHPLEAAYRDAGLRDVTARIYPGGRHEMLNETNREEVIGDLLSWLGRIMQADRAASLSPPDPNS